MCVRVCAPQDQAFQQGGMFVFDGPNCVWSHFDKATGAHADLAEVLGVARTISTATAMVGAAAAQNCDCPDPSQQQ